VDLSNTALVGTSQEPNFSGLKTLMRACSRERSVLQVLNIALNNLTLGGTDFTGIQSICQMLNNNAMPTLHSLNFKGNTLHSGGLCFLADALQSNTQLTSLELSGCRVTQNEEEEGITDGVERLAQMLAVNKTLTYVSLCKNSLGAYYDLEGELAVDNKSCTALFEALRGNGSSLTSIDLRSNNLNDSQMASIADALQSNVSLTNVSLTTLAITESVDRSINADAHMHHAQMPALSSGVLLGAGGASSLSSGARGERREVPNPIRHGQEQTAAGLGTGPGAS
jgi:hypothetical protein